MIDGTNITERRDRTQVTRRKVPASRGPEMFRAAAERPGSSRRTVPLITSQKRRTNRHA